jgi:hypothetical protein
MGPEIIQKCPGVEGALMIVPELFACPFCRAEIEIWTGERRARCIHCGKMISRERACPIEPTRERNGCPENAPPKGEGRLTKPEIDVSPKCWKAAKGTEVEVLEHTDASGSALV